VARHRLTDATFEVQAEQAAEIARLKGLGPEESGVRHLKKSDGVLCQGIPVRRA
jgi:hypothetical protein